MDPHWTAVKSNRTWLFWHRSPYMVLPLHVFHIFWISLQLIHYNTSRNLLRMEMKYFNLQNATEMKSAANKKTRCFKRSSAIKSEILEKVTIEVFYMTFLHPHGWVSQWVYVAASGLIISGLILTWPIALRILLKTNQGKTEQKRWAFKQIFMQNPWSNGQLYVYKSVILFNIYRKGSLAMVPISNLRLTWSNNIFVRYSLVSKTELWQIIPTHRACLFFMKNIATLHENLENKPRFKGSY